MAEIDQTHIEFANFTGQFAESFGFNRSVGQIYGLLYLYSDPLSLPEIAKSLSMSKGNASLNIRVLKEWGAVEEVVVNGSRKDHYRANTNIKELALRRFREGMDKRIRLAEEALKKLQRQPNPGNGRLKKIEELQSLLKKTQKALAALPTIERFLI